MGLRNSKYDAQEELAVDALGEAPQPLELSKYEQEGGIYGGGARGSMSKIPEPGFNFSIFPCGRTTQKCCILRFTRKEIADLKNNVAQARKS
jgi:zinc protease